MIRMVRMVRSLADRTFQPRSSSEANLATAQKLAHEKQVMETQYHHDKRFAVQCLRAQNGAKLKGSIGEGKKSGIFARKFKNFGK